MRRMTSLFCEMENKIHVWNHQPAHHSCTRNPLHWSDVHQLRHHKSALNPTPRHSRDGRLQNDWSAFSALLSALAQNWKIHVAGVLCIFTPVKLCVCMYIYIYIYIERLCWESTGEMLLNSWGVLKKEQLRQNHIELVTGVYWKQVWFPRPNSSDWWLTKNHHSWIMMIPFNQQLCLFTLFWSLIMQTTVHENTIRGKRVNQLSTTGLWTPLI